MTSESDIDHDRITIDGAFGPVTTAAEGDASEGIQEDADQGASFDQTWRELVTAALLGADRREHTAERAPRPISDLVADSVLDDPAGRLLTAVAATSAARRAGFVPLDPARPIVRPEPDPRPILPDIVARIGGDAILAWPILEDEWLIGVIQSGWRLPADQVVAGLQRTRSDAVQRARVLIASGAVGEWLVELFPALAFAKRFQLDADVDVLQPTREISPDVIDLVDLDAHTFADRLQARLLTETGSVAAERKIYAELLARARPAVLVDAADRLERVGTGLALTLADLARQRHRVLVAFDELGPAPGSTGTLR